MPGTALDGRRARTVSALGQCRRCPLSSALGLLTLLASVAASSCGPPPHGTIGAILGQKNDGRVFVRDAPPGLGAAEAGLRPGDEILFIDGVQASALSPEQLSEVLGGPIGAPVELTVLRDGQVLRVSVTRTEARQYSGTLPAPR